RPPARRPIRRCGPSRVTGSAAAPTAGTTAPELPTVRLATTRLATTRLATTRLATATAERAGPARTGAARLRCGRRDQALELPLVDRDPARRAGPGGLGQPRVTGVGGQRLGPDAGLPGQPVDLAALVRQHQGDHGPAATRTGGPAGAVQVLLGPGRRVDLEHQPDLVDVDAAGRDVGGDQHRDP